MSPTIAVRTVLTKYAVFSGRARRAEYWWFDLFSILLGLVVAVVDLGAGNRLFFYVVGFALLVPTLAVQVRRLHDIDRTGWWALLNVSVIGTIVLFFFFIRRGTPGPNRFGPSPEYLPGTTYGDAPGSMLVIRGSDRYPPF